MIGLIMGPQGSGKGTQAEFICKDYKFKHCSMGDMLKDEVAKGSKEGELIKQIQKEGKLVPEEITNRLAEVAIKNNEKVLFDGYPRNMPQANFLFEKKFLPDLIIVIDVSERETVKRLEKRRVCTSTKKIFISDQITKKEIAECESLGGKIIQRDDDKPEAIKQRLKIYHEQTQPLLDYFKKLKVKIIKINGEQPIEKVYKDIQKELKAFSS